MHKHKETFNTLLSRSFQHGGARVKHVSTGARIKIPEFCFLQRLDSCL